MVLGISEGNSKLGNGVKTWSLPAITTCPGRSEVCTAELYPGGPIRCYAMRSRMKGFQKKYEGNLELARKPGFAEWLIAQITKRKIKVLRIHVSGDFFSKKYTRAWLRAMRECPETRFYFYSRSWREPGYTELFAEMALLPNVAVWFSVDKATGYPAVIPQNVRVAYLAVDDADADSIDNRYVDLIFRDYPSRSTVLRSVKGRPVCPHENGKDSHITCTDCGLCPRNVQKPERRSQPLRESGRLSLTVL